MTIIKASESPFATIEAISTGLPQLDRITGVGGIPRRRITEISGPESAGKTTLALSIVREAQQEGITCLWADVEWSFDLRYATHLGVNTNALMMIQEDNAEDSLDDVESFAAKEKNAVIVIDAVGALKSQAEGEKRMEGKTIGIQANLVSRFLRKIVPIVALNNHALILLNHEFKDIMNHGKIMTSGGAKLAYHKSLWLKLTKVSKYLVQGDTKIGEVILVETRKNKLAIPRQQCEIQMVWGEGFSREADKLQELIDSGRATNKGRSWFLDGKKVASSRAEMREWLKTNEV